MSYGFQSFGTDGSLKLDVSDRLSRIVYWNDSQTGSVNLPSFSSSNGCYGFINRGGGISPSVSVSWNGSTLTWSSNIAGAAFVVLYK